MNTFHNHKELEPKYTKIKNKKLIDDMVEIEKKIKKENLDKYSFGKLYNEKFREKFKSLNKMSISDKKWHNLL